MYFLCSVNKKTTLQYGEDYFRGYHRGDPIGYYP